MSCVNHKELCISMNVHPKIDHHRELYVMCTSHTTLIDAHSSTTNVHPESDIHIMRVIYTCVYYQELCMSCVHHRELCISQLER